jgi:hypothetical protein
VFLVQKWPSKLYSNPKTPQITPKHPKNIPKTLKNTPKHLKNRSKTPQNHPKHLKNTSKNPQNHLKIPYFLSYFAMCQSALERAKTALKSGSGTGTGTGSGSGSGAKQAPVDPRLAKRARMDEFSGSLSFF